MKRGEMRISATSDSLLESAYKLLALAKREGAAEAEVFGLVGRHVEVDLRRDNVELASFGVRRGLGLRAVVSGAVGFSSTSDLSRLEDAARNAVRAARARGQDQSWVSLPRAEAVVHPEKVFDSALERIRPEECVDLAMSMLEGCALVRDAKPISGGVACASGEIMLVNSWGVELQEKRTLMHASLEAIAKGNDVATGSEFFNSRAFIADLGEVGKKAGEMAAASLGGSRAESGSFHVLLAPLAWADLLENAFLPSIMADNVQKGRSTLGDRVGREIASPNLNMVDDGLLAGGMGSSAFDGEGVPSRSTSLLEKGVLKGFLYDSYAAGKAGAKSTGNAVRGGYSDIPRVWIRNLVVSSGRARDLSCEPEGILVNGLIGGHTANPVSGDFSVEARNSFYISSGEKRPIRSLMLAGNIFELLSEIEVGTDARAVGDIVTPTVKVKMRAVGS
jgi:PmbA protein